MTKLWRINSQRKLIRQRKACGLMGIKCGRTATTVPATDEDRVATIVMVSDSEVHADGAVKVEQ